MKKSVAPLELVQSWGRKYPGIWANLDCCKAAKTEGEIYWPDYCDLPINASIEVLHDSYKMPSADAAQHCSTVAACYTWRKHKIIYRFDPDMAAELAAQAEDIGDSDKIPVDILFQMPYPCVYIEAPGIIEKDVDGFFAFIDFDIGRKEAELRTNFLFTDGHCVPGMALHLTPGMVLEDGVRGATAEIQRNGATVSQDLVSVIIKKFTLPAMQLLLYIISDKADIEDGDAIPGVPSKRNRNLNAAVKDKVSELDGRNVGIRYGTLIRRARTNPQHQNGSATGETGSPKRPHSRRGHWHHFWTGKLESQDRRLVLKWVAPTFIHGASSVEDVAVIAVAPEKGK